MRLWQVNLYVHNISHYHVQFNVTIELEASPRAART
jgi:hypothetical protein